MNGQISCEEPLNSLTAIRATDTSIQIVSGNGQAKSAAKWTTAVLDELKVNVTNAGSPAANVPVVFESAGLRYLDFTNASGDASVAGVKTAPAPISGVVKAYIANSSSLSVNFSYAVSALTPVGEMAQSMQTQNLAGTETIGSGFAAMGLTGSAAVNWIEVAPLKDHIAIIGDTVSIFAKAVDLSGSPVAGATITFSATPGAVSPASAVTDSLGMVEAQFRPDNYAGSTVVKPIGKTSMTLFKGHTVTISTTNVGIDYRVAAIPGKPSQIEAVVGDSDTSNLVMPVFPYHRLVWAKVRDAYGNPVANARVKFEVLDPASVPGYPTQTIPPNFKNAAFSKYRTEFRNYPWPFEVIGGPDQEPSVTVLSNDTGWAYAGLVMGNASNLFYYFKASLENAAAYSIKRIPTVDWGASSVNWCVTEAWPYATSGGEDWTAYEPFFQGKTIDVKYICFQLQAPSSDCNGYICSFHIHPLPGIPVQFSRATCDGCAKTPIGEQTTGQDGIATMPVTIQDSQEYWINPHPQGFFGTWLEPARVIIPVTASDLDVRYKRMLSDGGSWPFVGELMPVDNAVRVLVYNTDLPDLPLFDTTMDLIEDPFLPGGDILKPLAEPYDPKNPNRMIIYSAFKPWVPTDFVGNSISQSVGTYPEYPYFLQVKKDEMGLTLDRVGGTGRITIYDETYSDMPWVCQYHSHLDSVKIISDMAGADYFSDKVYSWDVAEYWDEVRLRPVVKLQQPLEGDKIYFWGAAEEGQIEIGGTYAMVYPWPANQSQIRFQWQSIFPRYKHSTAYSNDPCNPGYTDYTNVQTKGFSECPCPNPGIAGWLGSKGVFGKTIEGKGMDIIEYTHSTETYWADLWEVVLNNSSIGAVGANWYTLEAWIGTSTHVYAPGQRSTWTQSGLYYTGSSANIAYMQGITDKVMRVVRRSGHANDFISIVEAFHNVPWLYGSDNTTLGHQTERFVGFDCADLMTGAGRLRGWWAYPFENADWIGKWWPKPAKYNFVMKRLNGKFYTLDNQDITITIGTSPGDVHIGDLIVFDKELTGEIKYDHVAAISIDQGSTVGILDGADRLIEANAGEPDGIKTPLLSDKWDRFRFVIVEP